MLNGLESGASGSLSREDSFETARGIKFGDNVGAVVGAYGEAEIYDFNTESPLYSADSEIMREMVKVCRTLSIYECAGDKLMFFYDEQNCVNWILVYKG